MSQHIDPALLRGMTRRRYGRRDALRMAGLGAAGLALAGCGVEGKKAAPAKQSDIARFWAGKTKNGQVVFANWPEYMPEGRQPLKRFTQRTGIKVEYKEVIQENAQFFGKYQQQLAANQSIGFDIIVLTNGIQLSKMLALGYVVPLDHGRLPSFAANVGAGFKNPSYDRGNVYTIPWQSGVTGIAYNTDFVDREITGIRDLFDPRYKGKVGMMSDTQEIANFAHFLLGQDPEKSTPQQWEQAAAKLKEQRDQGIVRKYYDQNYIDAVAKGDVWLTMAWSGDVFSRAQEGAPLKFVIPEEGGTIWTDNMMIPKGARNPVDALMLMDHFYNPQVAAELAEFIWYITPVPGTKSIIESHAAAAKGEEKATLNAVAASPLIFPAQSDFGRLRNYRPLSAAEEPAFQKVFEPITQG
jgi:spermidine/putrescine transport system substrate-binding protein